MERLLSTVIQRTNYIAKNLKGSIENVHWYFLNTWAITLSTNNAFISTVQRSLQEQTNKKEVLFRSDAEVSSVQGELQ